MTRLLVVTDGHNVIQSLAQLLRGREPEVDAAASNSEVVDLVSNGGDLLSLIHI